ncbi:hypothetical protein D9M68_746860 [compost metagenome]
MDIDRAPGQLRAQILRQDLHVARQHHQLGTGLCDDLQQPCFLRGLVLRGHRQVVEGNPVPVGQGLEIRMVGDDGRHLHLDLAGALAIQQVVQAVVELGHGDQHLGRGQGVMHLPLQAVDLGHGGKGLLQHLEGRGFAGGRGEHRTDIEVAAGDLVELGHLHDVAAVLRQKGGDSGDCADDARTAGLQYIGVLSFGHCRHCGHFRSSGQLDVLVRHSDVATRG